MDRLRAIKEARNSNVQPETRSEIDNVRSIASDPKPRVSLILRQHRKDLYEYKSNLMVAVFGCFTMQLMLWPNAPIIGGWAVFFNSRKYIFLSCHYLSSCLYVMIYEY